MEWKTSVFVQNYEKYQFGQKVISSLHEFLHSALPSVGTIIVSRQKPTFLACKHNILLQYFCILRGFFKNEHEKNFVIMYVVCLLNQ